jgi:hypothetical protein
MVQDLLDNPPTAEKNNPILEETIKRAAGTAYVGMCIHFMTIPKFDTIITGGADTVRHDLRLHRLVPHSD